MYVCKNCGETYHGNFGKCAKCGGDISTPVSKLHKALIARPQVYAIVGTLIVMCCVAINYTIKANYIQRQTLELANRFQSCEKSRICITPHELKERINIAIDIQEKDFGKLSEFKSTYLGNNYASLCDQLGIICLKNPDESIRLISVLYGNNPDAALLVLQAINVDVSSDEWALISYNVNKIANNGGEQEFIRNGKTFTIYKNNSLGIILDIKDDTSF